MKRLIAAVVPFFAFALPSFASEAFILDIPVRGNAQQETGKVLVTLGLSAPPAGAQLVVNGTTTINLGASQSVNGDSVSFTAGTGNEARITYTPLSNFAGDFCSGGGAIEKQIPLRFVGAQDVADYRMTTYIVAAPTVECSQAAKHTGDTPAFLIPNDDGVAPQLDAIYKGRNNFDVMLVLDKSGSMADNPPGAAVPPSKASILKSVVDAFVSYWEQVDLPTGTGAEWSKDRLALVFFDTTAASQTLPGADPPANIFLQRGSSNAWDAVATQANTLTPGATTSIGAGINEAMSQWKADPKNDLSLVVVTDGMQNTAPLIQATNTGFLGLAPVAGFPQELRQRFVPIQTIGFGIPATVDEDLLRNISLETNGVSYMDANATTLFDDFASTLLARLKGNTATLGTRVHGTMTGAGPSTASQVYVDRSAQRIVFCVEWAPPYRNALDLEVYRPGSAVPATPTHTKKIATASFQTFDLGPKDLGTWSFRVKRASSATDPIPYTVNAIFLERNLDFDITFDNFRPYTGDPITVRAIVDWSGKRLGGLPPGSIRMRVSAPPQPLGTILHQTRVASAALPPLGGDLLTAYEQKIAFFKGSSLLARVTPKEVDVIPFKEVSQGVYTATFFQTAVPGNYRFDVILDWDLGERTGHTHREERLDQTVKLRPDPVKTLVGTVTKDNVLIVSVTPRDRFGNYLGPGYASLVKMRILKGDERVPTPVDTDQTGTYTFKVPAGTQYQIIVDGVIIGARELAPTKK